MIGTTRRALRCPVRSGAIWTPADWYASKIEADWRADDVVLTDGKVSTWTDQTGRHHAVQTNAIYRPTVETGADFGGKQVIRGAGGGIGLQLSTAISGLSVAHVFWIGRITVVPAHSIWGFGTATTMPYYYLSGNNYEQFATDTRMTTAVGSRDQTVAHCYEVLSQAGSYVTRFNGVAWGSRATNTVAWKATQCLLCESVGAGNTIVQLVARTFICSSEITGSDRTKFVGYLNSEYGLSMV